MISSSFTSSGPFAFLCLGIKILRTPPALLVPVLVPEEKKQQIPDILFLYGTHLLHITFVLSKGICFVTVYSCDGALRSCLVVYCILLPDHEKSCR